MPKRTKIVEGRTIAQFARRMGVGVTTVRDWIAEGRLDVIEYRNGEPYGRDGVEPLLILILDTDRPQRRIPQ